MKSSTVWSMMKNSSGEFAGVETRKNETTMLAVQVDGGVVVESQSGNSYFITMQDGKPSCSCADFKYRRADKSCVCKHIAYAMDQDLI